MGHTTDFVGHLTIEPVLHRDEIEYVMMFGRPFQVDRPEGGHAPPGLPEGSCPWQPSRDGSTLTADGHADCGEPAAWLRFLVGYLLRPRAKASLRELPQLEHFTFDHLVHGMVVGCRRETGELVAITARDRRISTKVLWPADPSPQRGDPAAPALRRDRPRAPSGYGEVIDLAARRARGGAG